MSHAPLHLRTWPASGTAKGTALLLHGAESHTGWFEDVAVELAAGGLTAVAYDRAGWGQSPGARGRVNAPPLAELAGVVRQLGGPPGRLHLVGLSWGGLLAACARAALPGAFATVTLLAPALFPTRRPGLAALLRAGARGTVPLPLAPADFTRLPARQAFIAADPLRTTAVGRDFCLATLPLLRAARRGFLRDAGGPLTQVLLAAEDRVIDNRRTRELVERRGGTVFVLAAAAHSLVLEDPRGVAAAVLALAAKSQAREARHAC